MKAQYYYRQRCYSGTPVYKLEDGILYFYGGTPAAWRYSSYEFKDLHKPISITKEEAFAIML